LYQRTPQHEDNEKRDEDTRQEYVL